MFFDRNTFSSATFMSRKLPLHSFHVNNSDRTNEAANYQAKWIASLLYREILIIFIHNIATRKTDKNNTRCNICYIHVRIYIGSRRIPDTRRWVRRLTFI